MKKIKLKKILYALIAILILIQFIPTDRSVEAKDPALHLFNTTDVPEEVQILLKNSCADCHSDNTAYPWYAKIQPVSKWIQGHIDHGRKKMNFAAWGSYSDKRKNRKIEECMEELKDRTMPLKSYTFLHPKAKLSDDEINLLLGFFQSLQ